MRAAATSMQAVPVLANKVVLALDVGGTDIKAGLIDDGTLIERDTFSTQANRGPESAIDAVVSAARDMVSRTDKTVDAIGLIVPGIVDAKRGVVEYSENLGWREVPIAALVQSATNIAVACDHDVRAAGVAEWELGAGVGADDFVFLPIGTGLAAALVLNGRPYSGAGLAGEVGHGGIQEGRACVCGLTGCVETDATAGGIVATYNHKIADPELRVTGAIDVEMRAQQGDAVAEKVWSHALDRLADTLVTFVQVLDPPLIVIGGGLSNSGQPLLDGLSERLDQRLSFHHRPQLALSALGSSAGMWGAALLAGKASKMEFER